MMNCTVPGTVILLQAYKPGEKNCPVKWAEHNFKVD